MRSSGKNKSRKPKSVGKSAGKYEREYMQKGLMAGSAAAAFVLFVFACINFPGLMVAVISTLVVLAVIAGYLWTLSRDIDFSGNLRK